VRYSLFLIVLQLFAPVVSSASNYMGMSTSHFSFYFHAQDKRLMKSLIDEAEGIRGEILGVLGIEFEWRTTVYLAPSSEEFQQIQPRRGVPSWSAGVAYPSLHLIIMKSPRATDRGRVDLEKVFRHEFTHIATGSAFKGREKVPRWLDEGLAMYISKEWDLSRVSTMARAVLSDSLIPLSEITQGFPQDAERAELAYSESFYLISFLISRYGKEDFHRFIRSYGRGKGLRDTLMAVYGIRGEDLEEEWRSYLSSRFSYIPIVTSATTLWFLVTIAFIIAYVRRRRARRLKLEELDREDGF
jgi:hypothetical protein